MMQTHISTTPFGRRTLTLGQVASQAAARAMPAGAVAHKWQVFQHVREARSPLGATDRALAILNALLTFHPETELAGDGELIVWPSNEQLMARANGISPATLRRHLAVLVDCGLIIRRDSPNGKRFARKGRDGEIEQAYGFDLSPLVARAEEIRGLAQAVAAQKQALRVARERLTLLRRDIVKMIDTGIVEGVPGDWERVLQLYTGIVSRLPRTASVEVIDALCMELRELWEDTRDVLESFAKSQNMSGNESRFDAHIQNSNTHYPSESENSKETREEAARGSVKPDNVESLPRRDLPLGIVLDACPRMVDLLQDGKIRQWRDLVAAADLARPMLGISPSAWREACDVMGEHQAAITVAAIYQRADQINSAGGYLRSLTERARDGKFSTWPMVMALLRAKLDGSMSADNSAQPARGEGERMRVSDSLLRSLRTPKPR